MTEDKKKLLREIALLYKEIGWARQHLINTYNLIKDQDTPPIEFNDPAQRTIFDAINDNNTNI